MEAADAEVIFDRRMRRQESLYLARRFSSQHLPFLLPGRLVRHLTLIVQSIVLVMFGIGKYVALGGSVSIAPTLHQNIKCKVILIDCAP